MSESETTNKFSLIDLPDVPEAIDNAAKNLSDLPTKEAGKTIADIWFLVFGGLSHAANKKRIKYAKDLELYKHELYESISKIPSEKQVEASVQITAQALENSKYCIEERELRKMFTSLISNSMNSDFQKDIHPSFAEIIKQMSVLDAKILKLFKTTNAPIIGLPVCQYVINLNGIQSSAPAPEHIFLELPDEDLLLCSQSLSSLSRFGLVVISYTHNLTTPNIYDKFSQHSLFKFAKDSSPFMDVSLIKGVVSPTPLGRSFIKVCIPD